MSLTVPRPVAAPPGPRESVPPPARVSSTPVAEAPEAEAPPAPTPHHVIPRATAALAAAVGAGLLIVLQLWSVRTGYALRVTSDVPTYLALIKGLIAHPFAQQSPFLALPGIESPHATPYMLGLAQLWHAVAPAGRESDPFSLGRFLGFAGMGVSLATLAMIGLFARKVGGRGRGLLTVAVVLVMFGPANVIWADDLTFHSFLYAGFYPQNVATALLLATLLALSGRGRPSALLAAVLSGTTMLVHPMTGILLCGLAAAQSSWLAARREPGAYRASFALIAGFLAATAWPDYHVNLAMGLASVPGVVLVAACAVAPRIAALVGPLVARWRSLRARVDRVADAVASDRAITVLAVAGALIVAALALWEVILIHRPPSDPLVHSNRLAVYWGEDRWRWFLMYGAGAVGIPGLVRLARRGRPLPLIWFTGCYGIALLGQAGRPVPVWWRFLLLGQVPLALGVAVVLTEGGPRIAHRLSRGTLGFSLEFKLLTLLMLPTTLTYFGSDLQPAYSLGRFIPASPPGLVASDPFTSYYVPGATGRQVLTETKAHVGSQPELDAATGGYALLHGLYVAPDANWWPAAQALWRAGVRYVLIEKRTSLLPATLEQFSTGPTPLIRTQLDQRLMGRMHYRLNRIGSLANDSKEYALYMLDGTRLGGAGAG